MSPQFLNTESDRCWHIVISKCVLRFKHSQNLRKGKKYVSYFWRPLIAKFGYMKQHAISGQNQYVIKLIAKALPHMPLGVWDSKKIPKNKWFLGFTKWLFTFQWPNGDRLISDAKVIAIQKRWFGLMEHDRNHERRMRRAYINSGLLGVVAYLNGINIATAALTEWINDFHHTEDDIRQIRTYQKKIGKKLLV